MAQSNQAVWGVMDEEVRSYKGPPSLAITEHWNYEDEGKDFFGGYCYMSQGPLPQLWANTQIERARPLGLPPARGDGETTIMSVGLKIVGEMLPQERNRVTLADEVDQYGLRDSARHLFLVRQRQAADRPFAEFMRQALEAVDATRYLGSRTTTPAISTARRGWATIPAPASSMPTAAAGTSRTCGSATARCFRRSAASIRR